MWPDIGGVMTHNQPFKWPDKSKGQVIYFFIFPFLTEWKDVRIWIAAMMKSGQIL